MSDNNMFIVITQPVQAIYRWGVPMTKHEAWVKYPETKGMSSDEVCDWIQENVDPRDLLRPGLHDNSAAVEEVVYDADAEFYDLEISDVSTADDLEYAKNHFTGRGWSRAHLKWETATSSDDELDEFIEKSTKEHAWSVDDRWTEEDPNYDEPDVPTCIGGNYSYEDGDLIDFWKQAEAAGLDPVDFEQFYFEGELLRHDDDGKPVDEFCKDWEPYQKALEKKSLEEIIEMNRRFMAAAEVAHV